MNLNEYVIKEVSPALNPNFSSKGSLDLISKYGEETVKKVLSISSQDLLNSVQDLTFGLEEEVKRHPENYQVSSEPHVYVVGGQPGAGKSSAIDKIKKEETRGVVNVEMDAYRTMHPNIEQIKKLIFNKYENYTGEDKAVKMSLDLTNFTQAWSDAVAAIYTKELFNKGYNIVMESTLRHPKSKIELAQILKRENPSTKFYTAMVAVSQELAYRGSSNRGKQMQACLDFLSTVAKSKEIEIYPVTRGAISKDYYDSVCADLPGAMDQMISSDAIDGVSMITRAGDIIYDSNHPEIANGLTPSEIELSCLTGAIGKSQYEAAMEEERKKGTGAYGVSSFMKENSAIISKVIDTNIEELRKMFLEVVNGNMENAWQAVEKLAAVRLNKYNFEPITSEKSM